MSIKKLPFFTFLLSLMLLLSFVVNKQHDEQLFKKIEEHYQGKLFEFEAPVYIDYLSRKLNIEGGGPSRLLDALNEAHQNNNTSFIIKTILKDSGFTYYIQYKGSSFIEEDTLNLWADTRVLINPLYQQTSSQQLGLSTQSFQIGQILTHLVSHPNSPSFALLIICFALITYWFERLLGAFKLYYYILISAFASSLVYLTLASKSTHVLEGPLSLVFGLSTAILVYLIKRNAIDKDRLRQNKVMLTSCILIPILLLSYLVLTLSALLPQPNTIAYILSSVVFPALASGLFMHFSMKLSADEKAHGISSSDNAKDWEYRAELSKALDFLSRFEFNSARQILNSLANQYPDSRAILEQRYHLAKLQGENAHFWKLAQDLIDLSIQNRDYERICRLFSDIQKNAASKKRAQENLAPEHYHKIMALFIHQGDLPRAEQAFLFLELGGDKHIIQDACRVLIEEFKLRHINVKQQQYEMLLERLKA